MLQAERDAPVDVQMGPLLLEDVRQDVRSRLWLALANDQTLCKLYENGQVGDLLDRNACQLSCRSDPFCCVLRV